MIATVVEGFNFLTQRLGDVVSAIFDSTGSLNLILPIVGISVGITIVGFGIATVKNLIGRY